MEGMLDFEYKKYVLLSYLQHISREFAEYRLYPSFSDLIFHYNNLHQFRENQQQMLKQFPAQLNEEQFRKMRLQYESGISETPDLQELSAIVDYALPNIQNHLQSGKGIYEEIDHYLQIEPIGITPLYKKEGYILLRINEVSEVKAFVYRVVFFENVEANYYGISFDYRHSFTHSLANTYESMKRELIRNFSDLPNPATYLLFSQQAFPEVESLIPVAKRKMLAYLK